MRARLHFGAACFRRVARLADPPVRRVIGLLEALAAGDLELPVFRQEAAPVLQDRQYDQHGRPPFPSQARSIACCGVVHFARQLGEPGWLGGHLTELAAVARQAVADESFPERDLGDFALPPELEPYREEARRHYSRPPGAPAPEYGPVEGVARAFSALQAAAWAYRRRHAATLRAEEAAQCDLLRDVVPYPYEQAHREPAWRTFAAVSVARQVCESRDFTSLPVLGDALQDAGCEDEHLLGHCRGPGPHVPGCWAVAWVLGRE
jgi:hypothetical protein